MKTLIKNGRVVTAVDDYKADILIEDERISVIGASLQMEVDQTIDASGKIVIPGPQKRLQLRRRVATKPEPQAISDSPSNIEPCAECSLRYSSSAANPKL